MLQNLSMHIHSKSKKVCGTTFSVKQNCGKSAGHFGPFWVILGPFWAFLGHLGSLLLWAILGHFWAISWHFWKKIAESSNFLRPRWGPGARF